MQTEEYDVVTGFDPKKFVNKVNYKLSKGWKHLGSVSVIDSGEGIRYTQAIWREVTEEG